MGLWPSRVHRDLKGLDAAADTGALWHALRLGELVTNVPVLDRAMCGQPTLRNLRVASVPRMRRSR
jgi:hypothetical protein